MRALTMPAGDFPYGNTIGLEPTLSFAVSLSSPLLIYRSEARPFLSLSFSLVRSVLAFIKMHRAEEQRGGPRSWWLP